MEHAETNKENPQKPMDVSKVSSSLKAYLEARAALIEKYGIELPEWKE